tara:strand:+ start:628 stop:990 length:363 start_codon:yes stop_codon:yes gene_type:complete
MARQNDTLANFAAATNKELTVSTGSGSVTELNTESTPAFLMLQNVGTVPVFYRLSANAASSDYFCTTADTKYSGILAAGDADKDGTGGVMTFAGYTGGLAFTVASGSGKVNISYSGRLGE